MGSNKLPTRFARTEAFYGEQEFKRIRAAQVAVIGLGGVGTHATLALARSGVGRLLLVDFDKVTPTSLNRNPVAGPGDIGEAKAEVLARHLAATCPDTQVKISLSFFHSDSADELLGYRPDQVVDAIDSRVPKVALIEYCVKSNLRIVSSMGASARRDVGQVRINDISKTRGCALARQVRKLLRKRGITTGVKCVYSLEGPVEVLPPDMDEITLNRGRVRNTLPSQICLPGVFGYALAAEALEAIAAGRSSG